MEGFLVSFGQSAIWVTLVLAGPVLIVSLIIGSLISLLQAATQINEITLTFVPKILGIGLVLALLGSWMGQQMVAFTTNVFVSLATLPK